MLKGSGKGDCENAAYMLKADEYPRRMLKKSAIGVLAPLSYSWTPPYASPPTNVSPSGMYQAMPGLTGQAFLNILDS